MRCESARQAMLEADPQVLEGWGEDPLAEHVRSCPRCGPVASRFLAGQAALTRELERAPREPSRETIEAVLARAREQGDPAARPSPHPHLSVGWRWWAPALAAAAVTTLVIAGRDGVSPPAGPSPSEEARSAELPLIEAPAGRNVAVLNTQNPSITVVWFF